MERLTIVDLLQRLLRDELFFWNNNDDDDDDDDGFCGMVDQ